MHRSCALKPTLIALLLTLGLVACRPEEEVEPAPTPVPETTGTLKVVVRPTWNGAPFEMNAVYENVSGYRVKTEGIKFYLGDVRLVGWSGSTVVRDVELFDLRHNGDTVIWTGIQPGTYSGLSAGFGVPQSLNDADPIVYPPGHPLDLAWGTYWTWSTAYRFLQFDGRYDLDDTGSLDLPFSMHTGLNICYQEFDRNFPGDVVVSAGSTATIVLDMAVDRFFYSATDTVDLATENQSHGSDPTHALALELTGNAINSLSVE
ncbi:MAG: MbnP family protein [Flavobacteriales bacterium]